MQNEEFKLRPPSKPIYPGQSDIAKPMSVMMLRALGSAKKHGIDVCPGTMNAADGNCAIESVIYNINDRDCFSETMPFSADYYRRIWMTDFKYRTDPTGKKVGRN